ncbi:MAG TPA: NADH-dependent [FeFe] hydrogenase, group A6 [Myxococcota bacterium]|nr:NADH-dependent [FeFe] hydrogenase, group A6 [Myxococcota bacterium]HQP94696.1 NADH-dependent [FeFe] hydrogenase, group A6 [Myxococcota bacterium]
MIKIQVNNREIDANPGEMLLEALNRAGIKVPTLCYMKDLFPTGACRMCVVEVEGAPGLVPSCAFPVREGLKIQTHSERAVRARKTIVELLLSNHPDDCLYCSRNGECHLQNLSEELGIRQRRYTGLKSNHKPDTSSPSIVREPAKCILCGKCVRTCEEIQGVSAIDFVGRGSRTVVSPAFNRGLNVSSCVDCGQCILACPTGALTEKSKFKEIFSAINDPKKFVVVQHAPAVSVTLGELFGINPGVDVAGVMNAALRRLGFDRVFDTSFSADLTIMEEASELFHRIKTGGKLPMFTSCCPAWIDFMEQNYPDMLDNLSTCKSPQQMLGAVVKTFYAERQGLKPEDIYVVSVMPCTAKKYEAQLPTHSKEGYPDVDAVITTRELARIIKMRGLHLESMEPEGADTTFGERSSAGKLFGATGGVMEAAIRTAHYLGTGGELEDLKVKAVRGLDGVKEAKVKIGDLEVGVAVAHTLGNARKLVEEIRNGRSDLHFIEIMSCPGGCVGGGGQPIGTDIEAVKVRMKALYMIDKDDELRVSHKNQQVQRLYDEYLGQPLGEKSHHILHTEYSKREVDF